MQTELMENERVIHSWNGVTVTDQRVVENVRRGGVESLISIPLRQVDYASVARTAKSFWLYAALGCWLMAIAMVFGKSSAGALMLGVFGVGCVVAYVLSRRVELRIGAGNGLIRVRLGGIIANPAPAVQLIQALDAAIVRSR